MSGGGLFTMGLAYANEMGHRPQSLTGSRTRPPARRRSDHDIASYR